MKKKNIFGKSVSCLIVAVLVIVAFIKEPWQVWALGGVFAVWGIYLLANAFLRRKKRNLTTVYRKKLVAQNKKSSNTETNSFTVPNITDPLGLVMLRHVNCRISSYLKSAYPDVTWEWCSESPERIVAEGGVGRIRLHDVPDFNFADVSFDQLARIDCDMLRIVPLTELKGAPAVESGKPKPDSEVDPAIWYDIQGKSILENLIADLNSRGHSSLTIKENGDICIHQADQDLSLHTLKNLPPKGYWKGLAKVFEKDGLAASVTDNGITVAW